MALTDDQLKARKTVAEAIINATLKLKSKHPTFFRLCERTVSNLSDLEQSDPDFFSGSSDSAIIVGFEVENILYGEYGDEFDQDDDDTWFILEWDMRVLMQRYVDDVRKEVASTLRKYNKFKFGLIDHQDGSAYVGIVDCTDGPVAGWNVREAGGDLVKPGSKTQLLDPPPLEPKEYQFSTADRKKLLQDIANKIKPLLQKYHLTELCDLWCDTKNIPTYIKPMVDQFINKKTDAIGLCTFQLQKVLDEVKRLKIEPMWPALLKDLRSAMQTIVDQLRKDFANVITEKNGIIYGLYTDGEEMQPKRKDIPPVVIINLFLGESIIKQGCPFDIKPWLEYRIIPREEYLGTIIYKWSGIAKLSEYSKINTLAIPLSDRKNVIKAVCAANKKLKPKYKDTLFNDRNGLTDNVAIMEKRAKDFISGEYPYFDVIYADEQSLPYIVSKDDLEEKFNDDEWFADWDCLEALLDDFLIIIQRYLQDVRKELKPIFSKYEGSKIGVTWLQDTTVEVSFISTKDMDQTDKELLGEEGIQELNIKPDKKTTYLKWDGGIKYNVFNIYSKIY